jgi:murein DD-endopeptidase MepM/ murein hydrolase activator NlpD
MGGDKVGWVNPVPKGVHTRGFAPASLGVDGPAYADADIRRAHDASNGPNGNGQGPFPGSTFYSRFHAALDIAAPNGTAILAPEAGTVLDAQWGGPGSWANGGGFFFRVEVNETCMYLGAHCSDLLVKAGQRVVKGQVIARVGDTGVATGNHLHFWARLGPKPYYDPQAFFWNPALVLPDGPMYDDPRFDPSWTGELPDTGVPNPLRVDGDPAPMRFRSQITKGQTLDRTIRAGRPVREGASVNSKVITRYDKRHALNVIGRIPKEQLPQAERQFGDVLVAPIYVGSGHVLGYIKQVDLAGN